MISKYNSEGYYDPTAYEALSAIEKQERKNIYRPIVYICSPYSGAGDVKTNTENARKYSRFAVDKNSIPFAPHLLLPQYISEEAERELALLINKVFLSKCDELWVFGEIITKGMEYEIKKAERYHKLIRYFSEEMEEMYLRYHL